MKIAWEDLIKIIRQILFSRDKVLKGYLNEFEFRSNDGGRSFRIEDNRCIVEFNENALVVTEPTKPYYFSITKKDIISIEEFDIVDDRYCYFILKTNTFTLEIEGGLFFD